VWHKQILTPKRDRLKKKKKEEKRKFDFCFSSHNSVSSRNPKQVLGSLKYWRFARNTLSEIKIQNLHP